MRGIAIFLAVAALAPSVAASAQMIGTHPTKKPLSIFRKVTVRYTLIANTRMTLSTPAGSFTCAPPTFPIPLPEATCVLVVPRTTTVALSARYQILSAVGQAGNPNGTAMTGKQWGGDCAGTIGDTCTLPMTYDRTVTISPYTAP